MRLQYARLKVEHGWVRRMISLSPQLALITIPAKAELE